MRLHDRMTRRQSLKKIMQLSGGLALAGITGTAGSSPPPPAASADKKFIVEAVGMSAGYRVKDLARKAFDAAGGIGRFVPKASRECRCPPSFWRQA